MFKLNSFFLFIIVVLLLGSCKKNNQGSLIYQSWGITLNPSGNSLKLSLDWGAPNKTFTINNINNLLGSPNTVADSVRIIAYYSFANPSVDSTLLNVQNINTLLTKKLESYTTTPNTDTFGTNPLYNIDYQSPFFAQNYLTIGFSFYYTPYSNIQHKISLVYNENNDLWNASFDTMSVEFRHNANGDVGSSTVSSPINWVAFNLNGLRPASATKDSFYIKMTYNTSSLSMGTQTQTYIVPAKWQ